MDWISVDEARTRPGLRLVLIKGGWGAWSECAKNILHVKKIPYAPVPQYTFQENAEIVAWTGVRNQPQAVYEDEPVRTGWLDILNLAERLAPAPPLLPRDARDRAVVVGYSNELLGEGGLGWCKRLAVVRPDPDSAAVAIMRKDYGLTDDDVATPAIQRMADVCALMAERLHAQKKAGSRFFVGGSLTALDIYWATMSNLIEAMPDDLCPLDANLRQVFSNPPPPVARALDPILMEHRDWIYRTYLQLPVDFG